VLIVVTFIVVLVIARNK